MTRWARATVDLGALRSNLEQARCRAAHSRVMAVVKADGYGHGLAAVSQALAGADALAVSCLEEAEVVRAAGASARLVLLEGMFGADELGLLDALWCDAVIHSDWQLELLRSRQPRRAMDVWLKVETGMHRLGFPAEAVPEAWRRLRECPGIGQVRFLTHLACADDRDDATTRQQCETLERACAGLPGERSLANSAGLLGWPEAHADWVRPGVMLYGVDPFADGRPREPLEPVMTLEARLIARNFCRRGEAVGYGGTWRAPEDLDLGIVSIGYGDGYPRHAPSGTPVLLATGRAPLVGRVSMDMLCIDLRGHPQARPGERVVLWGPGLPVEEVAQHCGTIGYELLCRLTPRVRRHYREAAIGP